MDPNKNPFDLFHSSFCILGVRVVVQMHNCEVHTCLCNLWWLRQSWEFAGSIFKDTHRGRVCIRVFIGVSVRALWVSWVVLCNLKKKYIYYGQICQYDMNSVQSLATRLLILAIVSLDHKDEWKLRIKREKITLMLAVLD